MVVDLGQVDFTVFGIIARDPKSWFRVGLLQGMNITTCSYLFTVGHLLEGQNAWSLKAFTLTVTLRITVTLLGRLLTLGERVPSLNQISLKNGKGEEPSPIVKKNCERTCTTKCDCRCLFQVYLTSYVIFTGANLSLTVCAAVILTTSSIARSTRYGCLVANCADRKEAINPRRT